MSVSLVPQADGEVDAAEHGHRAGAVLASEIIRAGVRPSVIGAITALAMPVAKAVAARLNAPLALVLARTLAAPQSPTVPFGALDEDGHYLLDYAAVAGLRLDTAEIMTARELAMPELTLARTLYGGPTLAAFLPAAVVLLVQGAMERGVLMEAAVEYAFRRGAEEIVVASAWATPAAAARFSDRAGVRLVCPWIADRPPPERCPTEEGPPHPPPQLAAWLATHDSEKPAPRRRSTDRRSATGWNTRAGSNLASGGWA